MNSPSTVGPIIHSALLRRHYYCILALRISRRGPTIGKIDNLLPNHAIGCASGCNNLDTNRLPTRTPNNLGVILTHLVPLITISASEILPFPPFQQIPLNYRKSIVNNSLERLPSQIKWQQAQQHPMPNHSEWQQVPYNNQRRGHTFPESGLTNVTMSTRPNFSHQNRFSVLSSNC